MGELRVLETFSMAKTGITADNEDGFYVSEDYIAVVDGSTDKTGRRLEGKTGGRLLKEIALETLAAQPGNLDAVSVFCSIQKNMAKQLPADTYFPAAAAMMIYSVGRRELWSIGDCQALVGDSYVCRRKEIDSALASVRAFAIESYLSQGGLEETLYEDDIGRKMILPFLQMQGRLENREGPFGYGVLNNNSNFAHKF